MRHKTIKQFALLFSLLLLTVWGSANDNRMVDGFSPIIVKAGNVQDAPKGSTIQASINGHMLTVAFADKDTPNDSMLYMDVFPNPISEIVNIEFSDELTEGILEIYNITGIKFDEIQVHDKTVSISMNHLPDGLYFINAKVDGRSVHNAKIIVNKTNKK